MRRSGEVFAQLVQFFLVVHGLQVVGLAQVAQDCLALAQVIWRRSSRRLLPSRIKTAERATK